MKSKNNIVFLKTAHRPSSTWLKWLLVIVLLLAGLVIDYYYADSNYSVWWRVLGWVSILGMSLGLILTTTKGRDMLVYVKESRLELRKVVWPHRQEVMQITAVVVIVVGITALLLWLMDSLLIVLIALLTGQHFS